MKRVFRFDDICVNADMKNVNAMVNFLKKEVSGCEIILCVSPLVHDMSSEEGKDKERIFPKILRTWTYSR